MADILDRLKAGLSDGYAIERNNPGPIRECRSFAQNSCRRHSPAARDFPINDRSSAAQSGAKCLWFPCRSVPHQHLTGGGRRCG
jgi:hypothetical protein